MWRFAAALPFTSFAGFRLGEDDREVEVFERGLRRRVFRARAPEEREPFFVRRRRPPPRELDDPKPGHPPIQFPLLIAHLTAPAALLSATLASR